MGIWEHEEEAAWEIAGERQPQQPVHQNCAPFTLSFFPPCLTPEDSLNVSDFPLTTSMMTTTGERHSLVLWVFCTMVHLTSSQPANSERVGNIVE